MKTSEVIKALQYMIDAYGDLKFTISSIPSEDVITSEVIHFGYDQCEEGNEINVRNFPY